MTMPSPSSHRKDAAAFSGACSAVNSQHFVTIKLDRTSLACRQN
jgi:hypothetical protein